MRRFVLFALLPTLLLASCESRFDWPWLDKKASVEDHRPQGQRTTEKRNVPPFQRINLDGIGKLVFDVAVPQGILQVQADQAILADIRTTVDQGTLSIREDGIQGPGSWEIEFRVAPPADLTEVTLGGMGTIESTGPLKVPGPLTVTLEGMGRIDLELAAKAVTATQKGSGELLLKGQADEVTVVAQGLGRVDASGLEAPRADVSSQGVGEVVVFASKFLKVRAQGLGAVRFKGNPAQTDVQTEGLTKVSPAD